MIPPPPTGPASARLPDSWVFQDTDYRHRLRLARGSPAAFLGPWTPSTDLLTQRRHWIAHTPERCLRLLPEGAPLVEEAISLARQWGILSSHAPPTSPPRAGIPPQAAADDPQESWRALATHLEPDLVLLRRNPGGHVMVAGAVCFPSSWAPEEKLGRSLHEIHEIVPGLNPEIGSAIDGFLDRVQPGTAWLRANWGCSASPELNQHPARSLPRLRPPLDPATTWLRVEHQAIVALPLSGGILFGIRIENRRLDEIAARPALAHPLVRALRTMPDAMARYKGLAEARQELVGILQKDS